MGASCSCCKATNIREPITNIGTAVELDLENDFEIKRKARESQLMNIACEVSIFNDKQKSLKQNIYNFINIENKPNDENINGIHDVNDTNTNTNTNTIMNNDIITKNKHKNIALNVPRIVVVGTQTAGKSSLINKMIGINLLPTGTGMVTRSPIYIEIRNLDNTEIPYLTLSCIDDGKEILFYQEKTELVLKEIFCEKINELTYKLTGNDDSVTKNPIVVRIYRHNALPLFLVDLPGLFVITRANQKERVIDDVKELIKEQLMIPNTYAIVTMQSKIDLETDLGLSIVKEVQKERQDLKTVGVLTKPDLLDKKNMIDFDTLIGENKIDKSLTPTMGFYVINNIRDEYFSYEQLFGKKSKILKSGKYGVKNLLGACKNKVIGGIFSELSSIQNTLAFFKEKLIEQCPQLRSGIREKHEKQAFIDLNLYILGKLIGQSIESIGAKNNIGPLIKSTIEKTWHEIDELMPFSETHISNSELESIINSFNGFTKSTQNIKTLIVSHCLKNEEKTPVGNIIKKIKNTTNTIKSIILSFLEKLFEEQVLDIPSENLNYYTFQIKDFPRLKEFVIKSISKIANKYEKDVIDAVSKSLIIQESTRRSITETNPYSVISIDKIGQQNSLHSNTMQPNTTYPNGSNTAYPNGSNTMQSNTAYPNGSNTAYPNGSNTAYPNGSSTTYPNGSNTVQSNTKNMETQLKSEYNNNLAKSKSFLGVSGTNGISIFDIHEKEEVLTVADARRLLTLSFEQITKIAKENAIKGIETQQLKKFQERIMCDVLKEFKEFYKKHEIDYLFAESDEMAEKNKMCMDFISDIDKITNMIDKFEKY